MKLTLLLFSAFAFVLIYFGVLPAGALLIFVSVSLAYLGPVYFKKDVTREEARRSLNRSLGVAFTITSIVTMAYALQIVGELSPTGRLQTEMYHIFVAPLLIGAFFLGRFLDRWIQELTNFMQYAAASMFCLYLALKNGPMNWQSIFLVAALFVWLSIQIFLSRREKA